MHMGQVHVSVNYLCYFSILIIQKQACPVFILTGTTFTNMV